MNVQAGAALHRPDPERATQALTAIKQASKESLHELRTTLGTLRREDDAPPSPACTACTNSSPRPGAPAWRSAPNWPRPARCPRRPTWRRTGSSRKP
ncbi:histidine kinase dimerization/phosphoacceptor domain-containing protein [Streptomyces broussonetiae]|uniref:Histidine kinase dimerization/phosphoacceptor domain-containing protein n=1 Tax=Streptomyces broussonetiae TaxID=2686304 RepID=A0ABV5EHR1_9ACTN